MRSIGQYTVAVAGLTWLAVLLPASGAEPGAAAAAGKPYAVIVERNIFGLVPIPEVDPASLAPAIPLPVITPNGIMNLFGQLQAMFKVAAKPPAKEASYVLSVGERQDEIEVLKIDETNGVITFNNHGEVQERPLIAAAPTGAVPPPAPGGNLPPGFPRVTPAVTGGIPVPMSPAAAAAVAALKRGNLNSGGNPGAFVSGASAPSAPSDSSPQEHLTPEAQVIALETQRAKWLDEGNPAAAIIPQTPLSSQLLDSIEGKK